ncbi:MAG: glycosyltransferase, partial [Opitutaceae bacterium]
GYGYSPRLVPWLKREAKRFDAVIVHGLWQYHGLGVYRALRQPGSPPYYGFPHGMLDPWFKRHYPLKHLKKLFYWWLAERRNLQSAAGVLFTCEEERRLARESFPGTAYRECVVAYGTAAPPNEPDRQREAFFQVQPGLRDRAYWLFLGRIHEKKGVDLLIDAYGKLAAQGAALPRLVIAGPCADAAYLRQLQKRAAAHCPPDAVVWPGMLTGDAKWGAFRAAEAFILPSHQENFGIAVSEALACGTPVLISDQVNIWREVTGDGAGLAEPDTADGTFQLLTRWRALEPDGRARMRAAALKTFQERYEIGAVARSLVSVLQETASRNVPSPTA